MRLRNRIATWWKAVTHANQFNSEIEDELAFHIDACAEDLMCQGVPEHEAFPRARAEIGSIASQKENCRRDVQHALIQSKRFAMSNPIPTPPVAARGEVTWR